MLFDFDYIHVKEIDSTNNFALNYITKTNPKDGFCIFTDYQTAGKGQYGRQWESNSGQNLLCSIILRPSNLKIENLFELHVITSLAIFKTLNDLSIKELKIKWPNDIFVGNNKIAGILIQNVIRGTKLVSSIIGIGLNVNQLEFNTNNLVSSIKNEIGNDIEIRPLLAILHKNLMYYYDILKNTIHDQLLKEYNDHLYNKNMEIQFKTKTDELRKGKLVGVNTIGQLIIYTVDKLLIFDFGEVDIIYVK